MAFLLSSERPAVAALSGNPVTGLWRLLTQAGAAHSQRVALKSLLELDEHRLDDLGISRQDVVEAMHNPAATGANLSLRRAGRAKAWSRSI
jgi:uncharacterized protein YjiS (DUF1127 family)